MVHLNQNHFFGIQNYSEFAILVLGDKLAKPESTTPETQRKTPARSPQTPTKTRKLPQIKERRSFWSVHSEISGIPTRARRVA